MSNELLDIYGKNGQPLGIKKPRLEVHQNGDWHKTVHIYVVNQQGQYLVHLRSPLKDLKPNCWDTRFGGHVISGDDYDQTVKKELEEEIGLKISTKNLIDGKISTYNSNNNNEIVKYYFYKFDGDIKELSFNDNEVVSIEWLLPEKIINSMIKNSELWADKPEKFKEINDYYREIMNGML